MTSSCAAIECNGWAPTPASVSDTRDDATVSALRSTLIETIEWARRGAWSEAEHVLHTALSAVAPEALPQIYIICVEMTSALLAEARHRISRSAEPSRPMRSPGEVSRPRSLPKSDPALNYAHAIVTALRQRLGGAEPAPVRQAS
jgi:hypothetical protein